MNFRLTSCKTKQPGNRHRTRTHCWKSVCFALRQSNEPYVGPSASSSAVSYLGAGQFGLGEHQGGGVDGVSQLLLHQLVGLGCLADPGEDEGGKIIHLRGLAIIIFFDELKGHNHSDYSNKLSRPVDGTKARLLFCVSATAEDDLMLTIKNVCSPSNPKIAYF